MSHVQGEVEPDGRRAGGAAQVDGKVAEAAEQREREPAGDEVVDARAHLGTEIVARALATAAVVGQHDAKLSEGHEIEDVRRRRQAEARAHHVGGGTGARAVEPAVPEPEAGGPCVGEPIEEADVDDRARPGFALEAKQRARAGGERGLPRARGEGSGAGQGEGDDEDEGSQRAMHRLRDSSSHSSPTPAGWRLLVAAGRGKGGIDPREGLCYPTSVAKALSKELKKPDEFVSFWTRFGQKVAEHRRKVIAVVVIGAVAFGAGWAFTEYRSSEATKATAAFARIERIASAELLPEKADATEPAAKPEAGNVPRFKTDKERLEAAIKEADAFVAAFGREGLGRKALLGKAARLLTLGQPAEAASIYESLAATETNPELRAIQQEGVAAAAEASGQLDEALRAYTALADLSQRTNGNFYLDRALFAKARILARQGKDKEAEPILREILTKVPKTLLRQQIDDRLALLAEK